MHPRLGVGIDRYLVVADQLLRGRIIGLYVVGSAALGAWSPDRSDIDIVVVTDRDLTAAELRRLHAVHLFTAGRSAIGALARGHLSLPGTVNATYVAADQLSRPVTKIQPIASHVAQLFNVGEGFDVNPVVWAELAEHGIAIRGPDVDQLHLDPEPEVLRQWNLDNLNSYWRAFGDAMSKGRSPMPFARPRWLTAWGVLGTPRLHCTIATGQVISKEAAGEYALDTFDEPFHPLIAEALAYWRGLPADPRFANRRSRLSAVGEFVAMVVDSANML